MARPQPPRPANLRLRGKTLFLTYPQCDTAPETILQNVKDHFRTSLEWTVIASEAHQSGEPHRHLVIALNKPVSMRNPSALDCLTGKHGNYQSARNPLAVLEYTIKDGKYLAFQIDVPEWIAAKKVPALPFLSLTL